MDWDAEKYQITCRHVTDHGQKLVELLSEYHCKRVLDIGCGTGVLTKEIAKFANEVIGIDLSKNMIEKAKAAYPELLLVMDACSLEWESCFSAAFSNAVFHFIKDHDSLLDSINRVLLPNGMLVCEFGACGNIADLLETVEHACVKRGKQYSLRFYYPSKEKYETMLEKHGFTAESIIEYALDTKLAEGANGLRNWVSQVFDEEMGWFSVSERDDVLSEIESKLWDAQWDGSNWHLPNRRLRFAARKSRHFVGDIG